jgi:tricorn protease
MAPRLPALLPVLFSVAAAAAGGEARFMSTPDIRGDRVVFAWEGDLYTTGLEGGTAIRLTSHPGGELAPKLSPDGKWIAYTTANHNVLDVWVMPSEGDAPTRLTWPPLGGQVVAWTPDCRHVVSRSRWGVSPAAGDQKLYKVGLDAAMQSPCPSIGARARATPPTARGSATSARATRTTTRSATRAGRTRTSGCTKPVTDYVGRNAYPMRVGNAMVFNSGADPDILQDNDPASVMAGKDVQLEKAVEVALQKIKEQPWPFPPVPAYPRR